MWSITPLFLDPNTGSIFIKRSSLTVEYDFGFLFTVY